MARGFGATLGVGATDRITCAGTPASSTLRGYHLRFNRNGNGGGDLGRFFDAVNALCYAWTDTRIYFAQLCTTGPLTGQWNVPKPATGAWHNIVINMDLGNIANDPAIWIDGVSETVVNDVVPTGAFVTTAQIMRVGNSAASDRAFDGMLADFAYKNAHYTSYEIGLLAAGYSARHFSGDLVEHVPMRNENIAFGGTPTIVGTAIQAHPTVIDSIPFPAGGAEARLITHGVRAA